MLKKKTLICLLLICAMVLSWVQPVTAADSSYGGGYDLVSYTDERAISYWKNFDIYSVAQFNFSAYGDCLLMFANAAMSATKNYYGGLRFLSHTGYGKTVLGIFQGWTSVKPYTSVDFSVGHFFTPSTNYGSSISSLYPGYSDSYKTRISWFFLNYADALDVYLNNTLKYDLYFLREDTRIYPASTVPSQYIVVNYENLGKISPNGVVSVVSKTNAGTSINDRNYENGGYASAYWLVPPDYNVLDGVWQANNTISGSIDVSHALNFSAGDVNYSGIDFQWVGSTKAVSYLLASGRETVYVDQWFGDTKKTIDLGAEPQIVSSDFYSWFTSNFTRSGDSEIYDDETCKVKIYDYGSGALIQSLSLPIPHIVYATSTGIQIENYSTAETLYSYTWPGSDAFAGFSLLSRDFVDYEVGTNFVNMSDSVALYLYGEDDLSGGSGGDPGGSGSTDPTDPTEPGGSTSTEPTVDPLDKEKEEINGSGNSALDDLTQAVPDYSQDFIAALGDLVRAFSYEGTNCELVIPALVLPGIDGLIPATELLPVTTVDFAEAFLIFPEKVVIVVRSLLTAALIIYCFKELYDTISYFLTLKRGDSNG